MAGGGGGIINSGVRQPSSTLARTGAAIIDVPQIVPHKLHYNFQNLVGSYTLFNMILLKI